MWRALVWLNLYGCEAVRQYCCQTWAQQQAKNAFFVFLGCFWAYVGQPHDYIGWATPMHFTSINPTSQSTNPWNFLEKILRIGGAGKKNFFQPAILRFFSKKKKSVSPWFPAQNNVSILFCTQLHKYIVWILSENL